MVLGVLCDSNIFPGRAAEDPRQEELDRLKAQIQQMQAQNRKTQQTLEQMRAKRKRDVKIASTASGLDRSHESSEIVERIIS